MTEHNNTEQISENDLIAQRHAKLKALQEKAAEQGKTAYPNTFKREDYCQDLQNQEFPDTFV